MCLNRGVTYNGAYCLGNALSFICSMEKRDAMSIMKTSKWHVIILWIL